MKTWMFDEKKHAGVDYANRDVAKGYDAQHRKFRNFEEEAGKIIRHLNLSPPDCVIDMGCGTGAFALHAAPHCKRVIAVDISEVMLAELREKARQQHIRNIDTVCAGFLSYEHAGEPADAVVSVVALHHLPDFWKIIALKRINAMLKRTGKLYLFDAVFSFPLADYATHFDTWIHQMHGAATENMVAEVCTHIRDEFSTTDTHMDMILKEGGFTIVQKNILTPYTIEYLCSSTSRL